MKLTVKGLAPELRPAFDDGREFVSVPAHGVPATRALLLWLWARGGCWVSRQPRRARELLERELAPWPRLSADRVRFLAPSDLGYDDFPNCVIEDPANVPGSLPWAREHVRGLTRTLEPKATPPRANPVDGEGLTVTERRGLLARLRAGEDVRFEEDDLVASLCRDSLLDFVREFWDVVVAERFTYNWHIGVLCDEFQRVLERVFLNRPKEYDLVVNVMPGSTKSMVLSVMVTPWAWTRMPSFRYIGGSYAQPIAMDLARRGRDVVKSTKYQQLFPLRLRTDQDAKTFFMNAEGGMRMAVGTGGVAGFHGHCIGVDDPLDPNPRKSTSEVELRAADDWIKNSLSNRKVEPLVTPIILIMQRLHNLDPTAMMLKRSDGDNPVRHVCLPAELTEDVKPREHAVHYVDGLMDPTRAPWRVLKEKRKLGNFMYSGQYLQRPTPLEGGMFQVDLVRVRKLPNGVKWKKVVRYWDKAGTKDGGAFTAGVKMGETVDGEFWVLDVKRGQWNSAKRERTIGQTATVDGNEVQQGVEQEPGSGGKESAENTKKKTLRGHAMVFVDRPTGDKALRADPYSVQVNDGNVSLVLGEWNEEYLNEMEKFPDSEFKDQIDASSGAFKMLTRTPFVVGRF